MAKRRGWSRRLTVTLLVILLIGPASIAYTPLANWLARPLLVESNIARADVIVVLGGGTAPDKSANGLRRLVWGIRLYRKRWAPRMLFSGADPLKRGITEAEALAAMARELGVPAETILLEVRSARTADHGREVARLLRAQGLSRVLLVTTPIHMRRALAVFSRTGLTILPAPTDGGEHLVTRPWDRLDLAQRVLHEYAGLLYYRWQGWI